MVTSSNNAESASGSKDIFAAKQKPGSSFGKKNSPETLDPAKSAEPVDEDEHLIRKSETFFGGKT